MKKKVNRLDASFLEAVMDAILEEVYVTKKNEKKE